MLMADRILGWILLLLALASLAEGIRTWDRMGETGFMPVIVGSIFTLLSLRLLTRKPHPEKNHLISLPNKMAWLRLGLTFVTFIAYTLTVPWIGYPAATALFFAGLLRATGKVRWRLALIYGAVTSASTYVIFKIWLNMPLPAGILGHWD